SISSSVNCRVGKGAGTACPSGKVSRTPCPRQENQARRAKTRGHGAAPACMEGNARVFRALRLLVLILILVVIFVLLGEEAVDLVPRLLDVVEQLDLGAVLAH